MKLISLRPQRYSEQRELNTSSSLSSSVSPESSFETTKPKKSGYLAIISALVFSLIFLSVEQNSAFGIDKKESKATQAQPSQTEWGKLMAESSKKQSQPQKEAHSSNQNKSDSKKSVAKANKKENKSKDISSGYTTFIAQNSSQLEPEPDPTTPTIGKTEAEKERKPVKIEELLTEPKKIILDFNTTYSHVSRSSGATGLISIEGQFGQPIIIPVFLGEQEVDQDFISNTLNIRYGLTKKLEVFGFGSIFTSFQRATLGGQRDSDSDFNFNFAGFGATYQIKREGKYPALLVSASTNVVDNTEFTNDDYSLDYFRTFTGSATTFFTVDPIVFLVQGTYRQNLKRESHGISIDPGEVFTLAPQVLFVVNPYITLTAGMRFSIQGRDKLNGDDLGITRTTLSPLIGVSYGITDNLIFSVDAEYRNGASYNQSIASFRLTYTFR